MKSHTFITASSVGVFCLLASSFAVADSSSPVAMYLELAHTVVASIEAGNEPAAKNVSRIDELLEHAKPIVDLYARNHPACHDQLKRMVELYPEIAKWTPKEIRENIERAKALPEAVGCYPARDIVAHPAIVRALLQSTTVTSTSRLVAEMNEAIEHAEEIGKLP